MMEKGCASPGLWQPRSSGSMRASEMARMEAQTLENDERIEKNSANAKQIVEDIAAKSANGKQIAEDTAMKNG
eukprot:CAMPEP_0203931824 /NCGR_PEP_ID=MMETSP0359-20131031/70340_1 /ASSEMBLY_ACC=CAM_ASM_000338 /TAXON_ID=268821 /ORGANISM="Scrippsiella Hangoei, Strain SHTV-5" /LENGTH=72 /DNA_ID=CAMNT_0050861211 /DNA_START=18 /DNA_END=234 /DNA_ORIENTATION=-